MSSESRSSSRRRTLGAGVGAALALGAGAILVVWGPWHGPILLSLSTTHGVDAGDLLVLPLVALAVVVGRLGARRDRRNDRLEADAAPGRWAGPISATVLGGLLLVVGTVILTRSTVSVPNGGGTFDGTVKNVGGRTGTPVGAWTNVALTYDGKTLRMYVNGAEVSHEELTGTIQTSTDPLWIGGNRPYGEYFKGMVDEVRVYNRALDPTAIATNMATPIESTPSSAGATTSTRRVEDASLVASYAFDAGSGTEATDSSGHGNDGAIIGATWARGRFGQALSFDGGGDVVRVPASPSLDLGSAMTLSAWIWPSVSQVGWRTIVQRETDAYFLNASGDLWSRASLLDDVVAGVAAVAAVYFGVELLRSGGWWAGERRRSWPIAVAMFLAGCLLDAALAPSGTVLGPMLVAVWFAATARRHAEAVVGWLLVAAFAVVTVVSLADLGGVGLRLARADGGNTRTAALGLFLVASGLLRARPARPRPSATAAS